ncbi:MAG: RAMP superfamily CRISPR-associated protein [Saprospiraceae bacterium]
MAKQQTVPGGLEGLAALIWATRNHTRRGKGQKSGKATKPTRSKSVPNLGWLFYFDYFRGMKVVRNDAGKLVGELNDKDPNQPLFAANLKDYEPFLKELLPPLGKTEHSFRLKTTYPGLLIGSGYQHETGAEGELKLGFFFDHTSGLPVIPGSSVKGVLRSVFHKDQRPFMVAP